MTHITRSLLLVLAAAVAAGASKRVAVSVPEKSSPLEQFAAGELVRYLHRIYPGYEFAISRAPGSGDPAIRLGVSASLKTPESFSISHKGSQAVIEGADANGVLYAVYALLEKLGCGFYLSDDALPPPKPALDFSVWDLADAPLTPDRMVFDWHNFLSSASSWSLDDWRRYLDQSAKMRFNGLMVHAYGNNPMFTFEFNGLKKPIGYLATTAQGRDWGTQHVNDVRRIIGGELFQSPVFGSPAAQAPENERAASATDLMRKVFGHAHDRGLRITFALDLDTESANPQAIIATLAASDRFSDGKYEFANPETPGGYAYYKAQVAQLLAMYPQIGRLAVWMRRGKTPWRDLTVKTMPASWAAEYEAALQQSPWLRADKANAGMFAFSKVVRAVGKALRELGRSDVELANGSWHLDFVRAADLFMPPGTTIIPLDWQTIFDQDQGGAQLTAASPSRKVIPIVWAHHDDRTYMGRPYTPYPDFADLLKARRASGFGIIHWTTRPLDLYFTSLATQVWRATANQLLAETCRDMAGKSFGASARDSGGEYLLRWIQDAPMFGRETSNSFMDVALKSPDAVIAGIRARIELLKSAGTGERLAYYRDYERFMLDFFSNQQTWEHAQKLWKENRPADARRALEECKAERVIADYAAAIQHGQTTPGERALLISLNLRWLPYVVSLRQALGMEAIRYRFGPTQHEPLAQSPGTNTFFFDAERQLSKTLGAQETHAAECVRDGESGILIDHPVALSLGPIMGDAPAAGDYALEWKATGGSLKISGPGVEQNGRLVHVDGRVIDLTFAPVRGQPMLSWVTLTPARP